MTDGPFFEPWPDPQDDDEADAPDVDLPWMPPVHVAGVVVPLGVDVYRGQDTVMRVTHAVAYQRGVEVHVCGWVRPGTRRRPTSFGHEWQDQEPRVGFRLADGTRLGHRAGHAQLPEPEGSAMTLAQTGGSGGGLTFSSSWWLHPLPAGDSLEVVVRWDPRGVPESSVGLDLAAIREDAEREDLLWDPPAGPGGQAGGWFAYAPTSAEAYNSHWVLSVDDEDAQTRDGPLPGDGD